MLRKWIVLVLVFSTGSVLLAADAVSTQLATPSLMMNDLRVLARARVWKAGEVPTVLTDFQGNGGNPRSGPHPPLVPTPETYLAPIAPPLLNAAFDGIPSTGVLSAGVSGDVGIDHYLQVVNGAFAFYSKTGDLVAGPVAIHALWPASLPCGAATGGGAQTRYDHIAGRWVISRYATPANKSPHICMAVSRGANPITGGWNLYAFSTDGVYPGAPRLALGVDGYTMTSYRGTATAGSDVWMFERKQMLGGFPAQVVRIGVAHPVPFLPGDIEPINTGAGGPFSWPRPGDLFVRLIDGERFGGKDRIELYLFQVYWTTPLNSTFGLRKSILIQAPFDSIICTNGLTDPCVPQPGTTTKLGAFSAFASGRVQRHLRTKSEKLLLSQTINVNGRPSVRWYDVQRTWTTGQDWYLYDWGTHSDDDLWRWNASIAMDTSDDIAFAFHAASPTVFPSIRAGVRRQGQPWATRTRETILQTGGGSQGNHPQWGGASSLELDPQNDCTLWFTGEYYAATSTAGWKTRIISFTHPNCKASARGAFVVTNRPDGGFGAWATGGRAYAGDFDGDGRSDILLLGSSSWSTAPIAFSNGDGSFRFVNLSSPLASRASAGGARVFVRDMDGNGKSDVVITGATGWDMIVVGLSNGDGTFRVVEGKQPHFAFHASKGNPLMGDFSGDGKPDLLVLGPSWGAIPVAISKGDGTFTVTSEKIDQFTQWSQAQGMRPFVGDFDGDGKDDVALTGAASWKTLPVAFSNGNGTFTVTNEVVFSTTTFNNVATSCATWAAQSNARVFAGSSTGDRKTDLVITGPSALKGTVVCGQDTVIRGKFHTYVRGNMSDPFGAYSSKGSAKTIAADFNGDGELDLALLGLSAFTTIPTAFAQSTSFNVQNAALLRFQAWSASTAPITGDFDGNGRMDIALVGASGATTLPIAFSITRP